MVLPASASTLRLTSPTDTSFRPGALDDTRQIGDTFILELWVNATDTDANGMEATLQYDGTQLQLLESSKAGDSFPQASAGVNSEEDHSSFGDILGNNGMSPGTSTDTARYSALTNADSARVDARLARFLFQIRSTAVTGQTAITYRSTATETTAVTYADTYARNVLSGTDTGLIQVLSANDTHAVLTLVSPLAAEYFTIFNPTTSSIDLSKYYVSDDDSYYITTTQAAPLVAAGNFIANFPAGTTLAPGESVTVALSSDSFHAALPGVRLDFEIDVDGASDGVTDMTLVASNGIRNLKDAGEPLILFYWDGSSDLVRDVDILVWGTGTVPNKTGKSIDGIDAGTVTTTYLQDSSSMTRPAAPATGQVLRRSTFISGDTGSNERKSGGNGLYGHDETSESSSVSWVASTDSKPWHTMLVAYKRGDYATGLFYAGDTNVTGLHIVVQGARIRSDTITQIDLTSLGVADTANIDTVTLWIDANGDSLISAADTFVANLTATGSRSWRYSGNLVLPSPNGYELILGYAVGLTVQTGETVQFSIAVRGVRESISDSGSFVALTNANVETLSQIVLRVDTVAEAAAVTFKPGDTGITVMAIRIRGNGADTMTNFGIATLGRLDDTDINLFLWRDADGSATYTAGDTFVSALTYDVGFGGWDTTGADIPLSAGGDTFIVTLSAALVAAIEGDSFVGRIPFNSAVSLLAFPGPAVPRTNAFAQTLAAPPAIANHIVIAAVYPDDLGVDGDGEWLLLYNPSDTPTNIQNWKIKRGATNEQTLPDSTIPPHRWFLSADSTYNANKDNPAWPNADFGNAMTIANTDDGLSLVDSTGVYIDRVGWGAEAVDKEGTTLGNPVSSPIFVRRAHVITAKIDMLTGGRDEFGGAGYDAFENSTDFVALVQAESNVWVLRSFASAAETPAQKTTVVKIFDSVPSSTRVQSESGITSANFFIEGDTTASATLTVFRIEATDSVADTNFKSIQIWRDVNGDARYQATDSYVATLILKSAGVWETSGIAAGFNGLVGDTFLVVLNLADTLASGDTFQPRITLRSVKTSNADSGPTVIRTEPGIITFSNAVPLIITKNANIANETVTPTQDTITVMAFRVRGAGAGDTLTRFTIDNKGRIDTSQIATVRLWRDANGDSKYSAGDTFVATLIGIAPRRWQASGLSNFIGSGADFVVTIDLGLGINFDTFLAEIPANLCNVVVSDTGPANVVSEPGRITVSTAMNIRILLTEVNTPTATDYAEAWVLDDGNGGLGSDISGWKITDYPLGGTDQKILGDTNNDGIVDATVTAKTGQRIVFSTSAGVDELTDGGDSIINAFDTQLVFAGTDDEILLYDSVNNPRDAVVWSDRNGSSVASAQADFLGVINLGLWASGGTAPDTSENNAVTPRTSGGFVSGYSIQRGGVTDRDTYLDWGEAAATQGTANLMESPPVPPGRLASVNLVDIPDDLGGALRITWTPDTSIPDFKEYRVYLETSPLRNLLDSFVLPRATVTDSSIGIYQVTSLVNGDSYYAAVTVVDSWGLEYRFGLNDTGPAAPYNNITGTPKLVINEVFSQGNGVSDTDYVEIFVKDDGNPTGRLNLSGWKLEWYSGAVTSKILGSVTVGTGDYITLTFSSVEADAADSAGTGIVKLYNSSATGLTAGWGFVRVKLPSDSYNDFMFYNDRTTALGVTLSAAVRDAVDSGAWIGDTVNNSAINSFRFNGSFTANDLFARDTNSSDTFNSRDDWNVTGQRSKGVINFGVENPITVPDSRVVRIFRDLPNDFGGSLEIGWDTITTLNDFVRYNIYIDTRPFGPRIDTSLQMPDSTVTDSSLGKTTVAGLTDGESYYVLITVTDTWGHERRTLLIETGPVMPIRNVAGTPVIRFSEVKFSGTGQEFIEMRVVDDGNAAGQLNMSGMKLTKDDTTTGDILTFGSITVTDSDYIVVWSTAGTNEVDSGGDGIVNIYNMPISLVESDEGLFLIQAAGDTILDYVEWSNRDGAMTATEQTHLAYAISKGAWANLGTVQNNARNPVEKSAGDFNDSRSITRDRNFTDNNGDTDWAIDTTPNGTPGTLPQISESPFAAPAAVAAFDAIDIPNDMGGAVRCTWTQVVVADLDHYNIYYETTVFGPSLYNTNIGPRDTAAASDSVKIISGLTNDTTYWFAITAVDSFGNERKAGLFVDSAMPLIDTLGPNVWYLNDAFTTGDSWTTQIGYDTALGLSPATPKRTFAALRPLLTVGDTVYIDAGLYTETFVIDTDYIAFIGADSTRTIIDPPGAAATVGLYGIFADTQVGIWIQNLAVTGSYDGVRFENVDQAFVSGDSFSSNGEHGLYLLSGSETGMITNDWMQANTASGLADLSGTAATIRGNRFEGNLQNGLSLTSSVRDILDGNLIRSNVQAGVFLSSADTNVVGQNEITGSETGVRIIGAAYGNVIGKNQFLSNSVRNLYSASGALGLRQTILRNWWNSTDSAVIASKVLDTASSFAPYRLGAPDTAIGADTVAPKAPDTVVAGAIDSKSIRISWGAATLDEEADPFAVGLSGYGVYRSQIPDTSLWVLRTSVGAGVTSFDDTGLTSDTTYYYRITSFDAGAPYANQSFYSDSIPSATTPAVDTAGPNIWYVNDSSTVGDSFTSAVGYDTNSGLTPSKPKRNITAVTPLLTVGDTILIDAGTFDSIVTVSPTETAAIRIDTNTIWVIGVDSTKTIIDPAGVKTATGLYGIYADTQVGLTIKNLAVTGAYDGIHFYNVDQSTISGDSVSSCGNEGIYLQNGSDTNTVSNNKALSNTWSGILLSSSLNNTVNNNIANSNNIGFELFSSSNNNTVSNNNANSNNYGIYLGNGSDTNTVSNNTTNSNSLDGIYLNSSSNTVSNNTTSSNGEGINLSSSSNNTVSNNTSNLNTVGILMSSSLNNTVSGNTASSNFLRGIWLTSSSNNRVVQNVLDSNVQYQVYIDGTSSSDTVRKNDIKPSPTNPDSLVYNGTTSKFDFTRNWWNTTDTNTIARGIAPIAARDSVTFIPFRLGIVDTAAAADTVAPKAPDTVAAVPLDSATIRITWSTSATNEEASPFAVNLAGYRVYRSPIADTSVWILRTTLGSGTTAFSDSPYQQATTFFYRVTAFDASSPENQSFYSDSIPGTTTNETTPPASFTLLLPTTGTETRFRTLTFRWSASSDSSPPISYRLIIDTDMVGAFVIDTTVFDTEEIVTLPANDTYLWRVIATDTSGNSRTVGDSMFLVDTRLPNAAVLSLPAANAETKVTSVFFAWTAATDTGSGLFEHRLQIDTANTFVTLLVDSSTGLGTSGTITLAANDTYFWRVVAVDDAGNTTVVASRQLMVDTTPPTAPAGVYPVANNETNAVSTGFKWTASIDTLSGLNAYHLQIDTSAAFTGPFAVDSDVSAAITDTAVNLAERSYFWRILARDDAGNTTVYTPSVKFIVDRTAPVIVSVVIVSSVPGFFTDSGGIDTIPPQDTVVFNNIGVGIGQSDTVTLVVTGADSVSFPQNFGGGPQFVAVPPYAFTYSIAAGLGDTTMVIIARDTAGNQRSETVYWRRDIQTPPVVGLVNPADSQTTGDTRPTFVWLASNDTLAGTKFYVVQIGDTMGFDVIRESASVTALSYKSVGLPNGAYYWRVIAHDSVSNADTAGAPIRRIVIDTSFPFIFGIAINSTSATHFYPDTPITVGLTPDTVYFNPTGPGAGQTDTITVFVGGGTDTSVSGSAAFQVIRGLAIKYDVDSYNLVYRIPLDSGPATITIVATNVTGAQDTALVRFEADTYSPTAAGLVTPAAALETKSTTVIFSWTAANDTLSGVAGYRLQIDTSIIFAAPFVDSSTGLSLAGTRTLPANDTYFWRVISVDNVANTTASSFRRLVVDTVPPVAAALLLPPANTDTNLTAITFTWSAASDSVGISGYRIQVDTSNTFTLLVVDSGVGLSLSGTSTLPANDTYFWRVLAIDSATNSTPSVSRQIRVDTTPPTAAALVTPVANTDTNVSAITFTWTAASDNVGILGYRLQIDTTNTFVAPFIDSATGLSLAGARTLPVNDTYYWRVLAVDSATNSTPSVSRQLRVDTTPPVAAVLAAPAANTDTNLTAITFTWAAATDNVGISGYRLQIDTSNTFVAPFVDSATPLLAGVRTLPANDTYFWRVVSIDSATNSTPSTSRQLRVDTTAPAAAGLVAPAVNFDTSSTTITFTWTAASDNVGVSGYRLQIDTSNTFAAPFVDSATSLVSGTRTLPVNDTYYWRVLSIDSATNSTASASRQLRLDTTTPTRPVLFVHLGDTSLVLRWVASSDSITGIAYYNVQIDSAGTFVTLLESAVHAWSDTTHTSTRTLPDTYYWRVLAWDSAGNFSTSLPTVDTFRILVGDTTPPSAFALTAPPDLTETRATTIILRWADSLDSSVPVRYRVQADTAGTFLSNVIDTSWLIDTFLVATFPANDTFFWRVIARDNSGNTVAASSTRRIVVDTAGPVAGSLIAPTSPTDTTLSSITFRWNAAADTGSGFNHYQLQVDTANTFVALLVDSATTLLTGVRTLPANDTYYWRIVAVDDAQNTTAVAANILRIDTALPFAGALLAPANIDTNVQTLTFTWTAAADSVSGIGFYRLQIDTANTFDAPIVDSATTLLTGARTLAANDTYYWRIVAVDNAGNTVAYASFRFRIDTAGPTIGTLSSPVANFDTSSRTITFTWTASSDSGSGVLGYRLQIDTANTFIAPIVDSATPLLTGSRTLAANDTYFWRVLAVDSATNTSAYASRRLRIDTTTPASAVLIKKNGDSFSTIVTLTWVASQDSIAGLAFYIVQVDTAGTFATLKESTTHFAGDTSHTFGLTTSDTYFWRVLSYDSAGNFSVSLPVWDSFVLRISDTLPPNAFNLTSPPNLTETSATTMILRWQNAIDDTSNPVRYHVQIDTFAGTFASPYFDSTGLLDTFITVTFRVNETSIWRVIATDNVGNTVVAANATWRVIVDTAGPLAGALIAPSNPTDTRATTITFSWNAASDTGTGINHYQLQIDTSNTFVAPLVDSATTLLTGARTLPANDTYYWRIVAVDDAGNTTTVAANTLRVDTAPPALGAPSTPAANTDTSATTITFAWTASADTGTGIAGYRLQIDTSNTFTAPFVDSATTLLTGARTLAANDTYYWRVLAVDNAGNTVAYASFRIRIDTSAPSAVGLVIPSDPHDTSNTSPIFQWTAPADSGSGVAFYRLQIDTSLAFTAPFIDSITTLTAGARTLPANDTYFWRVIVVDNAGNTTASTPRRIRIDTAAPTQVVLTKFNGDSTASPVTFKWSVATDSVTSVRSYVVQVDTAGTFVVLAESGTNVAGIVGDTGFVSALVNVDTYFWRVLAYDTVGNFSISATDSFVLKKGDTVPPKPFSLTSPVNNSLTTSTSITFQWTNSIDDSSPPVRYNLQIDTAGTFVSKIVDTSWLIDTFVTVKLAANDTYYWRVIARDNALNTTASSTIYRFSIDTASPSAPRLTKKNGAQVLSPVYLAWSSASDSISGVKSYLIQIARSSAFTTPLIDSVTQGAPDTDYFTALLAPDTYYWRVYAYDTLGNSTISTPVFDSFVVKALDTTAPIFFAVSASPSSVSNSGTTAVTFTFFTADSSFVSSVLMNLLPIGKSDSTPATPNTPAPSSDTKWTLTVTFDTTIAGGIYDLVVTVIDAANNSSTTTVRVTVTDVSPSMTQIIDTPLANIRASGNELSVVSTYGDTYTSILYQYRSVLPLSGWMTCTSSISMPNPDMTKPFWGLFWDISSLVSGRQYDVRAVGTANGVTDPSPGFIRLTVDNVDSTVNEYRVSATSNHIRRQRIFPDTNAMMMIADGGTSLTLPVGSVTETLWIRLTEYDTVPTTAPVSAGLAIPGAATFREFIREDGRRTFLKKMTLTLPYADTDPFDDNIGTTKYREANAAIYHFDEVLKVWVWEPTSKVDPVKNVVSATVDHFTLFAVLVGAPAADNLSNVIIYPNPFVPYDNNDRNGKPFSASDPTSGIIFDSLPVQVTVEIFNANGRRVATFSKTSADARFHWDAFSDDNRELASGMYIAVIKSSTGEQAVKKILIIR